MHEFFFKDGKEALFFEDVDRCAEVIKKLITNPQESEKIGKAAAIRAARDGYSLEQRVSKALQETMLVLRNSRSLGIN